MSIYLVITPVLMVYIIKTLISESVLKAGYVGLESSQGYEQDGPSETRAAFYQQNA